MSDENRTLDDESTKNETITTKQVAGKTQPVQATINTLENDLPPTYLPAIEHLEGAIKTIKSWADDASPHDIDALVGAPIIVDAEQQRLKTHESKVGSGHADLHAKLENAQDALDNLGDIVDKLTFDTVGYVVYVNGQFISRYTDADVSVETILEDADKEDPEELGLFPLDGFAGDRQADQAFPADNDLDLSDEHRTFFESTSDGGKIA